MPISIPLRHIDRMFPYEFYAELYEALDDYVPLLPTFTLKTITGSIPNEKNLFEEERKELKDIFKPVAHNNIIGLTPELQVLVIMPVIAKIYIPYDQRPLEQAYMFVQYYDKEQQPLFTQEQSIELIRQIPEILWDDPNLLIGIYDENQNSDGKVTIYKAPEFVLQKLNEKGRLYDN